MDLFQLKNNGDKTHLNLCTYMQWCPFTLALLYAYLSLPVRYFPKNSFLYIKKTTQTA